ncbi:hypothetical protein GW17_00049751 [Ensete ventricosum]|nr:hypothetical protein GW17_00049751 [Ensete ventricosum]
MTQYRRRKSFDELIGVTVRKLKGSILTAIDEPPVVYRRTLEASSSSVPCYFRPSVKEVPIGGAVAVADRMIEGAREKETVRQLGELHRKERQRPAVVVDNFVEWEEGLDERGLVMRRRQHVADGDVLGYGAGKLGTSVTTDDEYMHAGWLALIVVSNFGHEATGEGREVEECDGEGGFEAADDVVGREGGIDVGEQEAVLDVVH